MITLQQAKELRPGQVLVDQRDKKRWKVTGRVKTWKREPEKVKIPVKHGLYVYGYVTENDLNIITIE